MKKYKGFNTATIGVIIIIIVAVLVNILFIYSGKNKNKTHIEERKTLEQLTDIEKENLKKYKTYDFKYSYYVTSYGYVPKFSFTLFLPDTIEDKQYISNFKTSIKPKKTHKSGENIVAEYELKNLNEGDIKTITISGRAKTRTYDILTAQLLNIGAKPIENKEQYLDRYLIEEKGIEKNSKLVQKIAAGISGKTREEIVNKIYDYVFDEIEYTQWVGSPSAELTLKSKRGKCLDLSLAMVAICRAKNIPARIMSGNIAREKNQSHTWVEVYFDEYGWVTYDPTVQISYKNYYHNGMFQKRVMTKQRPKLNYIASFMNIFTPWVVTYSVENADIDKISISSGIEIHEVNE